MSQMKYCHGCSLDKEEAEFWKNQGRCKACRRAYDKDRYQTHYKAKRKGAVDNWQKRRVRVIREHKNVPCADCNQRFHFAAMQFDHLPGSIKSGSIANLGHS